MKKFIEKMISRLEEKDDDCGCGKIDVWEAISIVNQLAEEYKDKYVSKAVLEQVMWERDVAIEQLKELGYGLGEEVGWIPCSERLPEEGKRVLLCTKDKQVCQGKRIIFCEHNRYDLDGLLRYCFDDEIIAWQPLPPQPEGEPNVKS